MPSIRRGVGELAQGKGHLATAGGEVEDGCAKREHPSLVNFKNRVSDKQLVRVPVAAARVPVVGIRTMLLVLGADGRHLRSLMMGTSHTCGTLGARETKAPPGPT